MKTLFLFLLLFLQISYILSQKNVVITGKINTISDKTIVLIIHDLIKDRIILTSKIDKKGQFIFKFIQKYPHDNYLKYGKDLYTIFVHPNDSIHIEITDNKISLTGDSKTINEEIQQFSRRGWDFYSWRDLDNATHKLNPSDFKEEMSRLKNKFEDSISVFNEINRRELEIKHR